MSRLVAVLLSLVVVGCANPTPVEGPAGPVGPQGPAGTSITVTATDGGALITDADGGSAFLVQGPQGSTGPQGPMGPMGPQGSTGPQGPMGISPTAMKMWRTDGGVLGTPAINVYSNQSIGYIFLDDVQCMSRLEWTSSDGGIVQPDLAPIRYTGLNCTGLVFVTNQALLWPMGCYKDVSGATYRAIKPTVVQVMTAQSHMDVSYDPVTNQPIGVICRNYTETAPSVVVEQVTMPQSPPEVTFGSM